MAKIGRPREFDDAEILDIAIELFRTRGFAGTSISDLLDAFAMGRQSLYNAFESKHELFIRALDQYAEHQDRSFAPMRGRDAGIEAIGRFVDGWIELLTDPDRHGCLLVNSMLELGAADPEVTRRGRSLVVRMTNALYKSIDKAARAREIPRRRDPRADAAQLAAALLGLAPMAKSGSARAALERTAGAAVDRLRE